MKNTDITKDFLRALNLLEQVESKYFLEGNKEQSHKVRILIGLLIDALGDYTNDQSFINSYKLLGVSTLVKSYL